MRCVGGRMALVRIGIVHVVLVRLVGGDPGGGSGLHPEHVAVVVKDGFLHDALPAAAHPGTRIRPQPAHEGTTLI